MTLIDELFDIEHEAYRKSPVHSMDGRVKLILCLLGLLVTIILPYVRIGDQIIPWPQLFALLVIYMLFWCLYILSGASIRYYLVRLLLIMPFGCLPNHVAGKGMMRKLKVDFPDSNIVAVDYDPGATRINQENRIKLMLANAKRE